MECTGQTANQESKGLRTTQKKASKEKQFSVSITVGVLIGNTVDSVMPSFLIWKHTELKCPYLHSKADITLPNY